MNQAIARRCSRPLVLACAAALSAAVGCDQPTSTPPPDPTPPTTGPTAGAPATGPAAKPNVDASGKPVLTPFYAVGRVLGADGKPISVPGARVEVRFLGSAEAESRVEVGPDGTYAKPLKAGRYLMPTARIEFPFRDRTYVLPLTPARPQDPPFGDAVDGIVRDFVWKLSGQRDLSRDPAAAATDPAAWVGGTMFANYDALPEGRPIPPPPTDTVAVLTFTPKGPLADGSVVPPMVVERKFDLSRSKLEVPLITDIPLGWWVVTGVERLPDGRTAPMLFRQPDGKTWLPKIEGTFDRNLEKATLLPIEVFFTRKT